MVDSREFIIFLNNCSDKTVKKFQEKNYDILEAFYMNSCQLVGGQIVSPRNDGLLLEKFIQLRKEDIEARRQDREEEKELLRMHLVHAQERDLKRDAADERNFALLQQTLALLQPAIRTSQSSQKIIASFSPSQQMSLNNIINPTNLAVNIHQKEIQRAQIEVEVNESVPTIFEVQEQEPPQEQEQQNSNKGQEQEPQQEPQQQQNQDENQRQEQEQQQQQNSDQRQEQEQQNFNQGQNQEQQQQNSYQGQQNIQVTSRSNRPRGSMPLEVYVEQFHKKRQTCPNLVVLWAQNRNIIFVNKKNVKAAGDIVLQYLRRKWQWACLSQTAFFNDHVTEEDKCDVFKALDLWNCRKETTINFVNKYTNWKKFPPNSFEQVNRTFALIDGADDIIRDEFVDVL